MLPPAFRVSQGHSLAGRLGERGSLTRSGLLQHPPPPVCLQKLGSEPLPPGMPRTASLGEASSLGTIVGKKHPLKGTCGPQREHPQRDRAPHCPLQTRVEFQDPGPCLSSVSNDNLRAQSQEPRCFHFANGLCCVAGVQRSPVFPKPWCQSKTVFFVFFRVPVYRT